MDVMRKILIVVALIFGFGSVQSLAAETFSDIAKERRWAQQIIDTLFDGEAVWLNAAGHEFLAIEMESLEGDAGRAVIVIHGIGIHPNWDSVVRPLRVGLAEHGWHTLSIQMPVLPNDAESEEYVPLLDEVAGRVNAAVDHLRQRGQEQIVIVAHSMGATMAMRYMNDEPDSPVDALVLIGMQGGPGYFHDNASALATVNIPTLDLYGSADLAGVIDFTHRKAAAAREAGNDGFRQIMVDGADHFFEGLDDVLVETVAEWLQQATSS